MLFNKKSSLPFKKLKKEKAARRKNPFKSIDDFKAEAEDETVDNDDDWVDFEQQQLDLRRKELLTQAFWKRQDKDTLRDAYKAVFPGISDADNHTKTAYIKVIAAYLKENDAASRINLQAAVGIDGAVGTEAAQQKAAIHSFFRNSGAEEFDQHYLKYSDVVLDEVE